MPKRIQLSRQKGWRMPLNTKKVDRTSIWGNPFIVGKDGDAKKCVSKFRSLLFLNMTGQGVIEGSDKRIQRQLEFLKKIKNHFQDLAGKNLACWCKIGDPCHADVLLDLMKEVK